MGELRLSIELPAWITMPACFPPLVNIARCTGWVLIAVVLMSPISGAADVPATNLRSLIGEYCISCHGPDGEGDVDLSDLTVAALGRDAELAQKLVHVLDAREMPPEDEPQPSSETRDAVLSELKPILRMAAGDSQAHIRAPIRRMNRFQYNNAVVDLFDLNCIVFTLPERAMRVHQGYFQPETGKMPETVQVGNRPLGKSQMIEPRLAGVAAFPQDLRAEHGYDNRGDHLSLSPLLMDEFLKLGQSITQSPDFTSRQVGIWDSFFQPPSDQSNLETEVRNRLQPFLTKAFRGAAEPEVVDRYTRFTLGTLQNGADFTEAMKAVASATIASPRFLYIYDHRVADSQSTKPVPLNDFELASRLSFFLWGSLPDETLLSLAADGKLSRRKVLNEQIDRMLRDKKVKRFCDSFPSQWLQLDRIVSSVPDPEKFPNFYFAKYRISMHMMMEPLLLFETVLIENHPITQLIDSDFTYRSTKLDVAYGPTLVREPVAATGGGVTVMNFHRVPVTDRRVGGVITNAAVMTMTSGPERTQPITRGAWIASVIFNDPPDPPPADVPPLPEKPQAGEENLTLRQRLAVHRERADCRGCHEQIDPLGFALENFDPVGRWRDSYENGLEIDSSGELFRQQSFSDVEEFKDAILANRDRFARALAGHLLSFALARRLGPADQVVLDEITEAVAADDYKMQTLIREVIHSQPFQTKS